MATRPQTLYGLADSPVDLAAFMLDHGDGSGQPGLVQQVLEERLERPSDLTRDDILDNITLFWLTNTGVSSARLYWESKLPPISRQGRQGPGRREHLRRRDLPGSAELGRAGVPQPRLLQRSTTGAGTSPPGSSRSCSPKTSARRSDRCAEDDRVRTHVHMPVVRRRDRVAQLRATRRRRAARPRRPRELLDVHVHQLAAPGALRPRVVAGLPGRRVDRHRRPHAGVLVRARHRPRAAGDEGRERSTTRSRSTTTTRSGAPSPTTTGRRSTSSTADGIIRDEHFGEGRYEQSERVIQRLLGVERELVSRRRARRGGGGRLGPPARRPRRISATRAAAFASPTAPR